MNTTPNTANPVLATARKAIRYFLNNPGVTDRDIPTPIRFFIRDVSEFCPEAAYVSRELALHCLTSCFGNTLCIYHTYHDKAGKVNDTKPPRNHNVTGVPWGRAMNPKKHKQPVELPADALNCGCSANDALWDFLWWKTGGIYSPTLKVTEPWRATRLEPRARGLMVHFVQEFTHMTLEDIYSGTTDLSQTQLQWMERTKIKARYFHKELEKKIIRLAVGGARFDSKHGPDPDFHPTAMSDSESEAMSDSDSDSESDPDFTFDSE